VRSPGSEGRLLEKSSPLKTRPRNDGLRVLTSIATAGVGRSEGDGWELGRRPENEARLG